MLAIIGIICIFVMVFGGYILAGGHLEIILEAVPHEMIVIGGATLGAFLVANDFATVKQTGKDLICDTLRVASMNYDDPHQMEEVLDKRMEAAHHHTLNSSHALQSVADGLPALGIVAAVLGVIKTMGSIDQPPEILGGMIGGALVGTFLGVFLAYGFVGPMSSRLKTIGDEDGHFYQLVREVLIANLHRHSTNICIEVGRQNTPHHVRPSFSDVENALRGLKQEAAA